jgi:hypothetical protein
MSAPSKTINFTQGEDVSVVIQLIDKASCGEKPFNLTGFVSATAYFPAATGGGLAAYQVSLVSADLGEVQIDLDQIVSAGVNAADAQDLEVRVDHAGKRTIAQILGKLNVAAQLFS